MIQQEDQQLFGASSSKYHLPDGGLGDGMRGSGAVTLAWANNHTTIIQHTVTDKVVTYDLGACNVCTSHPGSCRGRWAWPWCLSMWHVEVECQCPENDIYQLLLLTHTDTFTVR